MVLRPDGAVWMPGPRRRLSTTALSVASSLVFGLAMIVVGLSRTTPLTFVVLLPAGAAWMVVIAGMNATNQASSPQWVHTRAASIFQIVLYTTFAVSAAIWGGSSRNGQGWALRSSLAGVLLVLAAMTARWWPLIAPVSDVQRSESFWPDPGIPDEDAPQGRVLVTVRYSVLEEAREGFLAALLGLRRSRLRSGAVTWKL